MARKNINYETPAKKATPAKKPPKRSYWYSDSPLKRVTKDLFGVWKSRLNNAKSPLIFVRTLDPKKYSLMGSKKMVKTPNMVQYVKEGVYTKSMQDKERKKPTGYRGMSAFDRIYWKKLDTDYYRAGAAKAKAEHKAKAIIWHKKQ